MISRGPSQPWWDSVALPGLSSRQEQWRSRKSRVPRAVHWPLVAKPPGRDAGEFRQLPSPTAPAALRAPPGWCSGGVAQPHLCSPSRVVPPCPCASVPVAVPAQWARTRIPSGWECSLRSSGCRHRSSLAALPLPFISYVTSVPLAPFLALPGRRHMSLFRVIRVAAFACGPASRRQAPAPVRGIHMAAGAGGGHGEEGRAMVEGLSADLASRIRVSARTLPELGMAPGWRRTGSRRQESPPLRAAKGTGTVRGAEHPSRSGETPRGLPVTVVSPACGQGGDLTGDRHQDTWGGPASTSPLCCPLLSSLVVWTAEPTPGICLSLAEGSPGPLQRGGWRFCSAVLVGCCVAELAAACRQTKGIQHR